ncbi:DDE-type integrase/transposase/recombinase [Hoeflea alexandrii]|nr:DDE-type integrase/transposase/recombinase [Hoeflea alexandrii]MCZ4291654.1 DDE-type integrase/transposase/recombinase [Hoeflea alexandrii]
MKCAGEKFWLWRAVGQHGTVLGQNSQKRRDKRAAKRLLGARMKRCARLRRCHPLTHFRWRRMAPSGCNRL